MRLNYGHFSAIENRRARERMRLLDPATIEDTLSIEDQYWTVPLMLRLMNRVDCTAESFPRAALALAKGLEILANRIPIRPEIEHYYESKIEKYEFETVALAVLCSALALVGDFEEAESVSKRVQNRADECEGFPRAEARRRVASACVKARKLTLAEELAEAAALEFNDLGETELVALSLVHLGNALNLKNGPGAGMTQYAKALYFASKTNSERSRRVITAAAGNLSRDAFYSSPDPENTYRWAAAAREAIKSRPASAAKARVYWSEAIAAHRFVPRYSIRKLERARDKLCELGDLPGAVACIADLAQVTAEYHLEELQDIADRSAKALAHAFERMPSHRARGVSPLVDAVLKDWARQPSDLEALAALRKTVARAMRPACS